MSGSRQQIRQAQAGGTEEHATNPLVASYDLIDFLTTVAFVLATAAKSLQHILPLVSGAMHIINYGLLGYIQAKGLNDRELQEIARIKEIEGTIQNDQELADVKDGLLPPKKKKYDANYAWDLSMYILKMMACVFLVGLSVISLAVVTGAVATFVNTVLFPIGYVITTTANVLKFGKNFIQGIYNYFKKDNNNESNYKRHHKAVRKFKETIRDNKTVTDEQLTNYVDAKNAIHQAGRENIQNGIFLGTSAAFLTASILFLPIAAFPPVAATVASALFLGAGLVFAIQGISVIRNLIRKRMGKPEGKTFFSWLTEKIYPKVTNESVIKKYDVKVKQEAKPAPLSLEDMDELEAGKVDIEHKKVNKPAKANPIEKVKPFSLYPFSSGRNMLLFAEAPVANTASNDVPERKFSKEV